MRLRRSSPTAPWILVTLLPLIRAFTLDCERARDDGKTFNFKKLDGPKTVTTTEDTFPTVLETAFTIDICKPLTKTGPKDEDCPGGTRVCGITTAINPKEHKNETLHVIPIAGDYSTTGHVGGGDFNPTWKRLSTSTVQSDRDKEGIRLTMAGGRYPKKGVKNSRPQKAVVEFLCDRKAIEDKHRASFPREEDTDEGNNGEDDSNNEENMEREQTDDGEGGTLKYISYDVVGKDEVLSLEWRTKYACEDAADGEGSSNSGHWGFFTWFIIILFLAVAAYLIFGSWLNYNRYSARGWDLVPHSETLRDIPYIFKDWMRRVLNTLQGGGSRGGYSAV